MLDAGWDLRDAWRPALVVREPCEYATAVTAHRAGIPQLQIGISQSAIEHRVLAHVAVTLERYGGGVADGILAAPYLTAFPASLDRSPWPDTRRFRQSISAPGELPDWWPTDPRPLVYVTFGSVLGHLPEATAVNRTALDAVAELPARVLYSPTPRPNSILAHLEVLRFVAGPAARSLLLLRYSGDPERKPPVGVSGYIETAGAVG